MLAKNGLVGIGPVRAPFTLRAPGGPDVLFTTADVDAIAAVLDAVTATAEPAHSLGTVIVVAVMRPGLTAVIVRR